MSDWTLPGVYQFRGHKVRYGASGAGAPIVLIHGTPFSSYVWRRIVPCLAIHRRVFYFDLLGYGQSDRDAVPDVSLGVQNQLFAELLDHWQLDRPDVVAHDFGGTTALRCHLLNGRDYRSLTLIDPVALSPWGSPFSSQVRSHVDVFRALPASIHDALVRAYIRSAHSRPMAEEDLLEYVRPWVGEVGQAAFYQQISQFDRRYTDEVDPHYEGVRCPTAILWGEEDRWIPVEAGHRLTERIPSARFQAVPDAGHLMHEDAPEAIVGAVLSFLSDAAMELHGREPGGKATAPREFV
jgi:pimeloyl-ACP methyl ester carboxylesterase